MKKFAILFLCLIFMCSLAVPAFAATSCEEYLDEVMANETARIEYWENELLTSYKATATDTYLMCHIADDAFFEKNLKRNKMSKFISEGYDTILFFDSDVIPMDMECVIYYDNPNERSNLISHGILAQTIVTREGFANFLADVDEDISAGTFGNVENVSLLFYDVKGASLKNTENSLKDETTLYVSFAYIESEDGEFLVPYTLLQTKGEQVLENGKIYTPKECAQAMREKISIGNGGSTEYVKTVLSIVGVILLLGGLGVAFVLVLKKKTKNHTSYDF